MALDGRMSARLDSSQRAFETGRIFENATLGPYKHDKNYPDAIRKLIAENEHRAEKKGWTPYEETMDLLRDHYTGDVSKPEKNFAYNLRIAVLDAVLEAIPRISAKKHVNRITNSVRYYSSVETGLDYFHGVDAWFEIQGENGETVTCTIDVTTDPNKRSAKADLIINQEDVKDPSDGEDAFLNYLDSVGGNIADILVNRMGRKNILPGRMKQAV